MALFCGAVRSEALAMDTGLSVILPWDRPAEQQPDPCPVLYLLHGLGDNHTAWTRYTGIDRYAREHGLAVVMPEVQRGFYCDMAHGPDYFTYVAEELPALCRKLFGLRTTRENTWVAGLSMGGYGALKCALTYPERYRGCASFSGVVDVAGAFAEHRNDRLEREFQALMGVDSTVRERDDLLHLVECFAQRPAGIRPDILLTCGTEDFLYRFNVEFQERLQALHIDHAYREWPGEHNWDFWDRSIQLALERWFARA